MPYDLPHPRSSSPKGMPSLDMGISRLTSMWTPREWITREYWLLEPSPASFASRPGWSNVDVDVVPPQQRRWTAWNFLTLWAADGANVGGLQTAGAIFGYGLDYRWTIAAICTGNVGFGVVTAFAGWYGSRYHVPYAIAARVSMGFYFSYFAVFSRLVLGLIYFGQNCYIAAQCLQLMLEAIWPSFKNYPNAIPANVGITSALMISYFVLWIVQLPLVMIHPSKLRWLFFVKSVLAVVGMFALVGWGVAKSGGAGKLFDQPSKLEGAARNWAFVRALCTVLNSKTTLALNIPDLSRYAKKPSATWWQALFVPLVYNVFAICGIVIASANASIYNKVYWNPLTVIGLWDNRAAKFFLSFAFCVSTIGTNIAANSVATSNDMAFMFPRWINLQRGAFLTCILGAWVTQPWYVLSSAQSLTTFLSGYAVILVPMLSIILADLWAVRKNKVHVPAMYQNEGVYRYTRGVNYRAVATLLIVVPINLPGLMYAINNKLNISQGYRNMYNASYLTGFTLSFLIYTGICRVFPPTTSFVDHSIETLEDQDEAVEPYGAPLEDKGDSLGGESVVQGVKGA